MCLAVGGYPQIPARVSAYSIVYPPADADVKNWGKSASDTRTRSGIRM